MNEKQKELMEKLEKLQKKTIRKQKRAMYLGYIFMIFITTSISWLIWTQFSRIEGIPYLTYWQSLVYTLLVFAIIFITADMVRHFQKGK